MKTKTTKQQRKKSYYWGIVAEYLAAIFLWVKGYRILSMRYKNPKGEIDILAKKYDILVAVEVKARQNFASGANSITYSKQKKIVSSLEWLMAGRAKITGLHDISKLNIRLDVILVVPWRLPQHIKDAWRI